MTTSARQSEYDVLVAGAGPAGLSATAALAERNLKVGCISPVQPPEWPNTYGIWLDELRAAGLVNHAERTWARTVVRLPADRIHRLDRAYALLDNRSLRDAFRARAEAGDVDWIEGAVVESSSANRGAGPVDVHLRGGETRTARVLVDATGHRDHDSGDPGFQVALGRVLPNAERTPESEAMTLMDYRRPADAETSVPDVPPTFLYSMEVRRGGRLYEETALVSRPKLAFTPLAERLEERLERRGLDGLEPLDTERVIIPMGRRPPEVSPAAGVLPFGAAAEMVHPATGYMVGRTLRAAPQLAETVADALETGGAADAVAEGWRRLWPADLIRTRRLLRFGMEALISMDRAATADFFDAFFSLPASDWRAYLSGTASPGRIARIMWRLYASAPWALRRRLTTHAIWSEPRRLLRAATGRLTEATRRTGGKR
ncbi:MAG: lycopene cyclase family protein [Bradymonadaceae bacterium]